jgi:hypothetical protein
VVQSVVQHLWPKPICRVFRTHDAAAGTSERPLHPRDPASLDGHGGTEGRGSASRGDLPVRGHARDANAATCELRLRAHARLSQDPQRQVRTRQCPFTSPRHPGTSARIPRFLATRCSDPSHFGVRQMGNVQTARADDRGFQCDRGEITRCQTRDRRRRPSASGGLYGVGQTAVCGK